MWLIWKATKGSVLGAAQRLGNEAYCPRETCVKIHRRDPTKTRRLYEKPLFPGYLFLPQLFKAVPEDRWARMLGVGFAGYLMHWDGKHLVVTDAEIERIKDIETKIRDEITSGLNPKRHTYQPGETTQIIRGVLAGAMARVVSVHKRRVEVEAKGRKWLVDLSMLKENPCR